MASCNAALFMWQTELQELLIKRCAGIHEANEDEKIVLE